MNAHCRAGLSANTGTIGTWPTSSVSSSRPRRPWTSSAGVASPSAKRSRLLRNRHVLVRNLRGHPDRRQREARRLLTGLTDGERVITLVVQATIEPTTWLLITGWDATAVERRLIERL